MPLSGGHRQMGQQRGRGQSPQEGKAGIHSIRGPLWGWKATGGRTPPTRQRVRGLGG